MRFPCLCISAALLSAACSGTGQPEVVYPAFAVGTPVVEVAAGDWTVTLDAATVAFGPVYFCAAQSGSATLCEAAIAEILRVATVDALDPAPTPLGDVRGFDGAIRSASFDYGIHWLLTDPSPVADAAAPGGHSALLIGRAVRGAEIVEFIAEVDVLAQFEGQQAVPSTPVSAQVEGGGARLDVHFNPGEWISEIDFGAAAESGEAPYRIKAGSSSHNAIVIAMVNAGSPQFVWSESDGSKP
jgi:hypothetical protein